MIEINLLPKELIKQAGAAAKKKTKKTEGLVVSVNKLKPAGLIAGASLLAVYILLFAGVLFQDKRFGNLSSQMEIHKPAVRNFQRLTGSLNLLNRESGVIDGLMHRRFLWARKLNSLSDSMVDNVWFTKLKLEKVVKTIKKSASRAASRRKQKPQPEAEVKRSEQTLIIEGTAISVDEEATAVIGKFMQNLQENEAFSRDFDRIELGSITAKKIEKFDSKDFVLRCYLNLEEEE